MVMVASVLTGAGDGPFTMGMGASVLTGVDVLVVDADEVVPDGARLLVEQAQRVTQLVHTRFLKWYRSDALTLTHEQAFSRYCFVIDLQIVVNNTV